MIDYSLSILDGLLNSLNKIFNKIGYNLQKLRNMGAKGDSIKSLMKIS